MSRFYRILSSVRLFLVLLGALILWSVIATIIPQGLDDGVYVRQYGAGGAAFLRILGFTDFFGSVHLAVLLALMEVNLILCTVPRLVRRVRSDVRRRSDADDTRSRNRAWWDRVQPYAADIIHLGLIVVLAGGVLLSVTREQQEVLVPTGATVELALEGIEVTVVDSQEITNENGVVIDWTIDLLVADTPVTLAINDPVEVAGLRFHFFHWGREPVITFSDSDPDSGGESYAMHVGEGLRSPDGRAFVFAGVTADEQALFQILDERGRLVGEQRLMPGEQLGQLYYVSAGREVLNGFTASRSTGRIPVVVGLSLIIAGMGIYGIKMWRRYG